jgi:hypothetical protein
MRLFYFSNIDLQDIKVGAHDFGGSINTTAPHFNLDELNINTSGDSVFIIDVHCTFKGAEKAQQQGGVAIYRHLLNRFRHCQDRLKVVFYSPIPVAHLVSLKPENYVLSLLPFVELLPSDKKGQVVESWTFGGTLQARLEENKFPQFNNASENMLSGWALSGANRIDLKGKRLLIVDDEWQQWKETYNVMLNGSVDYFLKNRADIKAEFKKLNDNTFSHLPKGRLARYDFIISDLYLWENHETAKWKTEDFINSISGLLLFKLIRDAEPAIPVIFHTTSTKFRIYETLSALGADGQVPKNVSSEPCAEDKTDAYQLFRQAILRATENYGGCWLNEFYRFVSDDKKSGSTWWRHELINAPTVMKEIIDLIKHAILAYKNLRAHNSEHDKEYLRKFFKGNEIDPVSVSASGIINNLGKVSEIMNDDKNPELQFIDKLRDMGSHSINYHLYRLEDIKIILVLLFQTLKENTKRIIGKGEGFSVPARNRQERYKYTHQLLYYTTYHNNWRSYIPKELRGIFKSRVVFFTGKYYSECWKNFSSKDKGIVKNQFKSIRVDPSNPNDHRVDVINERLIITFKQ